MGHVMLRFHYVLMAAFIAVFLVFDLAGHYAIYSKRNSFADILHVVKERGNLVILAPLFFVLALLALVIDSETAVVLSRTFAGLARSVWTVLTNWRSLTATVLALVFVFCASNMFRMVSLGTLVHEFVEDLWFFVKGQLPVLVVLIVTVVGYFAFALLGRILFHPSSSREAFIEWNAGTTIILAIVATAGFCRVHIARSVDIEADKWMDILKDYVVYFLIIVVYIAGLTKWANSEGAQSAHAGVYLALALLGAVVCAVALVLLDFAHIATLNVSTEPTAMARRRIIKVFIHARDVGLLVPMCVLQAVFLIWRVGVSKGQ